MSSIQETFHIFNIEKEKLESAINTALTESRLSIPEIIQIYYQITNVISLATLLKQQIEDSVEHHSMIRQIEETRKFISEKFNSKLHQSIMEQLTNSIIEITKSLESGNSAEKSKEEIESEAKLYEKLRQTMSTKEFAEQYDAGLPHD